MSGIILQNKYKLISLISTTKTSKFYLGVDMMKNTKVCIKKYLKNCSTYFKLNNIINSIKSLDSEYVVKFYDFLENYPTFYYLIVEYLDMTLLDYIKSKNGLSLEYIRKILYQLNLFFENKIKIIKNPLRLYKIFIKFKEDNSDFNLKINDMRLVNNHEKLDNIIQHEFCLSPEIIKGEKYTEKSNIWSIGVLLYTMINNEIPFKLRSEIFTGKLKKNIKNTELKNLVQNCLNVNLEKRYNFIEYFHDNFFNKINNFINNTDLNISQVKKEFSKITTEKPLEIIFYETLTEKYYGEVIIKTKIKTGRGILLNKEYCYIYKGMFENNKFNGKGVKIDIDDTKYEGDFKHNKYNGKGTIIYKTGAKYIGEFFNDLKDGKGIFYFQNGDTYEGEFKENKINGKGIYKNKKNIFEGNWKIKKGIVLGKGKINYIGSKEYYEGEFCLKFGPHGNGRMYKENGDIVEGRWVRGEESKNMKYFDKEKGEWNIVEYEDEESEEEDENYENNVNDTIMSILK